jgi:transcription antitermination factor NusG
MPDTLAGTPWAIVSDRHISPLRQIEYKRKPRGAVKAIPEGTKVRLLEGGFAGMDGVVQSVRNKYATVTFAGFPVPVQIGCWLLTEMVDEPEGVHVGAYQREQAARAA